MGTTVSTGPNAPSADAHPWYRLPAPWQTTQAISTATSVLHHTSTSVPFSDQNNAFGLSDVGARNKPTFADLNGDGDQDLLQGSADGNLYYFDNTGDANAPAFDTVQLNPFGLSGGSGYSAPDFVDIDGDGDFDLFVGDDAGNVQYFENTDPSFGSAPAFSAPQQNPFGLSPPGLIYASPAFVDIDDDGDADVFLGEGYGRIFYFENTGSAVAPAFIERTGSANPLDFVDTGTFSSPFFADIDGNGTFDLFTGWFLGDLFYYQNIGIDSIPIFAPKQSNVFGLENPGQFSTPAFVDADGDGDLDAFAGEISGHLKYFTNSGIISTPAYVFDMPNPMGLVEVGSLSAPAWADMDGDGDVDAFIGEQGPAIGINGRLFYFQNTGSVSDPAFADAVINPFGLSGVGFYSHPSLADFDDDGDNDLMVGEQGGSLQYFENLATGTGTDPVFGSPQTDPFGCTLTGIANAAPEFVDLDGDGLIDIVAGESGGSILFLKNTGTANAPVCAAAQTNPFGLTGASGSSTISFSDVDGDGDPDAFVGSDDGSILFFDNTGTATAPAFVQVIGTDNPLDLVDVDSRSTPSFADLDGDGDRDAFVGAAIGTISYYRNDIVSLPVELVNFTGFSDGADAILHWRTASESNNAGFEIQHFADGAWATRTFVAGAGTTSVGHSYSHRIRGLTSGIHRFRLRQLDFDGAASLSAEISVSLSVSGAFELVPSFPNPFVNRSRFSLSVGVRQNVRITVYNTAGRQVALLYDGLLEPGTAHPFVVEGTSWPSGLYLLQVSGNQFSAHRSLMLVR